jgi:pyrophosphatase PpaX
MKDYACYLFDADGTLLDTTELIVQCFRFTCRKYGGFEIDRERVTKNIGLTLRRQMELYLGPLTDERFSAVGGDHMRYQLSIYPEYLRVFPGVREGLETLRGRGKRLGVVTSRRRETLELYLKETGILGFFGILVTPEDTSRHKPDPEPVLAALSKLVIADKTTVLMVGDSAFDIECGARAGIDTAFVNREHNVPAEHGIRPTYVIDEFSEICAVEI